MIDLHCHSFFSDGIHSPEELVLKAIDLKLKCLSLTDHDTIAGHDSLILAAQNTSINIIRGIELSVRWKKYDIHILGYQINNTPELEHLIEQQSLRRIERAEQIGVSLALAGVTDAYTKACELAGHNRIGRPHFAHVLVNEGRAADMQSAFKRFLGRGKMAYVPTQWISIDEAVSGIVRSGGIAVIAHPLKYGLTHSKLHELIKEFKEAGGRGIEVVSGEMTVSELKEIAATSVRFDLLASSGSDFHGDGISRIHLGRQWQLPLNCTPIWHDWNIEQGTSL